MNPMLACGHKRRVPGPDRVYTEAVSGYPLVREAVVPRRRWWRFGR